MLNRICANIMNSRDSKTSFFQTLKELVLALHSYTYPVTSVISDDVRIVLDAGCGPGNAMELIRRRRKGLSCIGIDIYRPYIKECKRKKVHDDYVLADIRNLPFRNKSFDGILCLHVLEHLTKNCAKNVLMNLEKVARKQVIITTPMGFLPRGEVGGVTFEVHKSGFVPDEFKSLDYKAKSYGFKILFGSGGVVHRKPYSLLSRCIFAAEPILELLNIMCKIGDYQFLAEKRLIS